MKALQKCEGLEMQRTYLGAVILILVAVFAEISPLLHIELGLDIYLHDEYVVIPLANIIFWFCIVFATAWILRIAVRGKPNRLR
jgi:hypothetical protein